MKIAIDTTPLSSAHAHRGVGSYTRSLTQALLTYDTSNEYVLTDKPYETDADLVHFPYFDLYFLSLPIHKLKPTVVTIHDVIPLLYPKAYPPGLRGRIKFMIQKLSLAGVAAIVTDSDTSKSDIERYLGQSSFIINRVYLAADEHYHPLTQAEIKAVGQKYHLDRPYLLYVGDINYNKNLPGLLTAYSAFHEKVDLVLVSKALGSNIVQAREIRRLITNRKLTDRVKLLTNVPADPIIDLNGIYGGALWYIQPSFYEGFGLPVLEAVACKTPVLVSTGGSLPEITPPGSITFDPQSPKAMLNAIRHALALPQDKRQTMIEVAYQFGRQFTWQKTAGEMAAVYWHATKMS